ncbi:MAG: hypothetical protein ACFFER_17995 [Candidatus Thorarchaeota archaeon]
MNPIEEIAQAFNGFLEETDWVSDNNCSIFVADVDCVVLKTDRCLPSNDSCDFTIFIANNDSLDIVQIEAKGREQELEVIEPKFKYSDVLALMILSSICDLTPMSCRFLFIQIFDIPKTSAGWNVKIRGGTPKKKIQVPGGKFPVAPGFCGDKLQDLLMKYTPRRRGDASVQDYLNLCKCQASP